jgi:hypothetical protein
MLDDQFSANDDQLKTILDQAKVVSNMCIRTEHERLGLTPKRKKEEGIPNEMYAS